MHEAEKLIQEIRSQFQTLQALLNYLESQGRLFHPREES